MRIRIQLFAAARQIAGRDELAMVVADGATIADARNALVAAIPALTSIVTRSRWAANGEFVGDGHLIRLDAEIAVIPPVSGG